MAWSAADSQKLWPWLFPLTPSQFWGENGEKGIDLGLALHTPITSLTLGTVISTGWYGGGGVVCVASQLPNFGPASVYYQHLDTIAVKLNQVVHLGDLIGLSGGQLTGGEHPVTCCSTGPHIEVGINPPPYGIWKSLGPNVNPLPWLQHLAQFGPSARDLAGGIPPPVGPPGVLPPTPVGNLIALSDVLASGTGPVADTFLGIEQRIDFHLQFVPIDWSTLSAGTHWWDYVLPWQWQKTQDTVAANLGGAVSHNVQAFLFRWFIVMFGFLLMLAVVVGMLITAAKASGVDDLAKEAAKAAAAGAVAE